MSNELVKIETSAGLVELSHDIIKKYLGGNNCTEQELKMFLELCKYQKLNPFLREVYLIKYGTGPAQMVTGKEAFLKRASQEKNYDGHEVSYNEEKKESTAIVYCKNRSHPTKVTVRMGEYNSNQSIWKTKPITMLNKVALCQALRETFPESFGGMYSAEEVNTVKIDDLPSDVVKIAENYSIKKESVTIDVKKELAGEVVELSGLAGYQLTDAQVDTLFNLPVEQLNVKKASLQKTLEDKKKKDEASASEKKEVKTAKNASFKL